MTKTEVTIRLGIGIVWGLALVLLPLVFSTTTTNFALLPRTASTNTTSPDYTVGVARSNMTAGPSYGVPPSSSIGLSPSIAGFSIIFILLLIFLPSVVFSLVIRKWAEKRARDYG